MLTLLLSLNLSHTTLFVAGFVNKLPFFVADCFAGLLNLIQIE
jgi:hypothetical protein